MTNAYTAEYSGNVTFQEEPYSLNVWKTFTINGNATRFPENMEYDGTVIVTGDALNMAHIKATGDIIINGVAGDAELYAGHNIMIRGGANCGGKGMIQASGNITGNYFESANLKAGGPIEGNYFLGCSIETDDIIITKGRNKLVQFFGLETAESRPIYQKTSLALEQSEKHLEHLQLEKDRLEDIPASVSS